MTEQEKKYQQEDEIDLMNYLKVLIKRKWLIFGIFLLATITAGVFSFLMPKVYKTDTSIEVGRIGGEVLEWPDQIVEKVRGDVYGILVRKKLEISEEDYRKYLKTKAGNPKYTNLVKIEIESTKPDLARKILAETNNLILKEHQEKIQRKRELLVKDIERLEIKISSLNEEEKILETKVKALQEIPIYQQTLDTQFALLSVKERMEKAKQEIENLYLGINSLKRVLEDIRSTKVIKEPITSDEPVGPRPVFNIVIAGVLGIFLGVFWAFSKEWWQKGKFQT